MANNYLFKTTTELSYINVVFSYKNVHLIELLKHFSAAHKAMKTINIKFEKLE